MDVLADPTSDTLIEDDLLTAQKVMMIEAEALQNTARSLNGDFLAALDAIMMRTNPHHGTPGRVIVTGMGKSGHVARKIAATMASTGTPSYFVHPAEASHGDLGMITRNDIILALSNSGETPELANIVDYAGRFGIFLIAITSNPHSALAKAANVALAIPRHDEACPMGLAPTTSTTVMLGLGDAIAVACLTRRRFSPDDFQVFHPGGKLGRRLLKVSGIMHTGEALPLVLVGSRMDEALVVMSAKGFGCVGVIDDHGCLVGTITDGDLRRHMSGELINTPVTEVMRTAVRGKIAPDSLASEALELMNRFAITNLFVMVGAEPVGILHVHDCLRAGLA